MALPQGLNFRSTSGFVTDVAPATFETTDTNSSGTPEYPRTTAQGNTVGYETGSVASNPRNRNSGNDPRIAGAHTSLTSTSQRYRIDLPSSGTYNIRSASGDASYSTNAYLEVIDTTTSLGVLVNNVSTGAANSFYDASGTLRTAAAWPGSNTAVSKTFSTTICRFKLSTGTNSAIAHLYIESGGSTDTPINAGVGNISITGYAPTVSQSENQSVSPNVGQIAITGYAPTIAQTTNSNINADVGSIVITGYAPSVLQTGQQQNNSGGFYEHGYRKRPRTVEEERELLGIIPKRIKTIISTVAKQSVKTDSTDYQARTLLSDKLVKKSIEIKPEYVKAMQINRDYLLDRDIAISLKIRKKEAEAYEDEREVEMLLM